MPRTIEREYEPVSEDEDLFRTGWPPKNRTSYLNPDGTPTSRTFALRNKDRGELSVDVVRYTTPERSVTKGGAIEKGKFMLYQISVKDVLKLDLLVCHDPLILAIHGVDNPAHAFIWGIEDDDDIVPGLLARSARFVAT